MRITGHESASYVEFQPIPELSSVSFRIAAELKGRRVSYGDIALLKHEAFLTELAAVLQKRSGRAVLQGTYDFELAVEFDAHEKPWISFYLAEYIGMPELPGRKFMRLSLQGSFQIPTDRIGQLLGDFKDLFA